MARTDANPPLPSFPGEYVLTEVSPDDLGKAVKPKQFLHIDQSECIMCEGCVDICPWKCIHMLGADTVAWARRFGTRCSGPGRSSARATPPARETDLM